MLNGRKHNSILNSRIYHLYDVKIELISYSDYLRDIALIFSQRNNKVSPLKLIATSTLHNKIEPIFSMANVRSMSVSDRHHTAS